MSRGTTTSTTAQRLGLMGDWIDGCGLEEVWGREQNVLRKRGMRQEEGEE